MAEELEELDELEELELDGKLGPEGMEEDELDELELGLLLDEELELLDELVVSQAVSTSPAHITASVLSRAGTLACGLVFFMVSSTPGRHQVRHAGQACRGFVAGCGDRSQP